MCHAVIKADDPSKTIDAAIEEMGTKAMLLVGTTDLDQRDVYVQKALARIVMGAVCYLNTAKPDVRDYKDRQRPGYSANTNAVLIGENTPRDAYYRMRKGHWRFLAHSRFHRDEQGRIRTVKVRPAQVHYGAKARELPPEITGIEKKDE